MSIDPVIGAIIVQAIATAGALAAVYLKIGQHESRHRENDAHQNRELKEIHGAVNGRLAAAEAENQRLTAEAEQLMAELQRLRR